MKNIADSEKSSLAVQDKYDETEQQFQIRPRVPRPIHGLEESKITHRFVDDESQPRAKSLPNGFVLTNCNSSYQRAKEVEAQQ